MAAESQIQYFNNTCDYFLKSCARQIKSNGSLRQQFEELGDKGFGLSTEKKGAVTYLVVWCDNDRLFDVPISSGSTGVDDAIRVVKTKIVKYLPKFIPLSRYKGQTRQ